MGKANMAARTGCLLPAQPGARLRLSMGRRQANGRAVLGVAILMLILTAGFATFAAETPARAGQPAAPAVGTAAVAVPVPAPAVALPSAPAGDASAAPILPPNVRPSPGVQQAQTPGAKALVPPHKPFSTLDYVIFVLYLLAAVIIGISFTGGQATIKDYFLAGRGVHAVILAISILAALFSGISYLGAPAELYAHSITFMLVGFSFFIAVPLITTVFMPFFYHSDFYTAYQYLEARFSVGVRTISSAMFILRVVIWLALATYAPALALQQVTGIPLWVTILLTGALTTVYTTLGGMKAVIWTDVMQFIVLAGGQVAILVVALRHIPDGVAGVYNISQAAGKFEISTSLSPLVRVSLWGALLGGAFNNLVQLGTDQVSVQRYMTATNLKQARRATWIQLSLTLPTILVFYLSGLVLYAFYQTKTDPLAAGWISKADQILPYFVVHELPMGMPGVLIAAIYAASMSTVSAGINSLTTTSLVDFYQRLWRPNAEGPQLLRLAKWLTLFYGLMITIMAFFVARLGTLVEASNKAMGLVGGPLLGLFLLGMFSRRANATGAFIGWVVGVLVLLPVCFLTKTSFLWYAFVGCVTTFMTGLICSLALPPPPASKVEGLVVGTKVDERPATAE
jgi:SSS family transporter